MFDCKFDEKQDAIDAPKKQEVKGIIPLQDAFNKRRFKKDANRSDLLAEDVSVLGVPYLVNQVSTYAYAYSQAQGIEYITVSLCLAIAKEIGVDVENVIFNKKTFRQQLLAQFKADEHFFPIKVASGNVSKKAEKASAATLMQGFMINQDHEADLLSCITHC